MRPHLFFPTASLTAFLTALLALAVLPVASAQAAAVSVSPSSTAVAPVSYLALSDLLRLAEQAPAVRQAVAAQAQADAALAAARAAAGLSVMAGADATISALGGTEAAGAVPAQPAEVTTNAVLTLDGSLSILPWSPALESVRQAERNLQYAAAAATQARRLALMTTLRDYVAAVQAAEGVAVAEQALAVSRLALESAEARARDGLLDPAGVLDARAAAAGAEADLSRARAGVGQAERRLFGRLGQPAVSADWRAGAARWRLPALTLPALAERQAAAQARRPEVLQARAAVADAAARLQTAQRDARLPDASATLRVGQLGAQNSGLSVSSTLNLKAGTLGTQLRVPVLDGDATYRNGASLNIRASVPLIGGGRAAAVAQAEAALAQAHEALTQAEEGVRLELDAAYWEVDSALQNLAAARLSQQSAQASLERTRARVDAGLDTSLTLRQAEGQLARATASAAQAERAAAVAWLDLWRLSGELETALLLAHLGFVPNPAPAEAVPAAAPIPESIPTTLPATTATPTTGGMAQ